MEVKLAEQYIAEVLKEKFGCEFEVCNADRHLSYRSTDYDFLFPVGLTYEPGEQSLKRKVNRWLSRDEGVIKPNSHIIYNGSGEIQSSSVIGGERFS
ncbi:hypothetical protein C9J12_28435 [Photobacterium frigidiphilum]|uniref:Uncharacterized protein n=1 Tax=Photobacterium frigidiphilum TaxID=264736 RepID=A0A2T3J6B8_9GAMM|nr:hypothetical protein [Photobacterium frigidiphilum]PSU43039.1 hypothetical protein C9J12_28435 [Photobacterium frigidiphilum]